MSGARNNLFQMENRVIKVLIRKAERQKDEF